VVWRSQGQPPPEVWDELIWPHYPWDQFWTSWEPLVSAPSTNPSVNMAFELFTDVCPDRTKKWAQPPDMKYGVDLWSWTKLGEQGAGSGFSLRADDFISDGRRITDIHWWGSYSNWQTQVQGSETNPVAPPKLFPFRPIGFYLSWHTNNVVGCRPGDLLALEYVPIDDCHEVYYGTVDQFWIMEPNHFEHEYQYYVDLWDAGGPWNEMAGGHYWLNIQAVFTNQFMPNPMVHGGWGWKVTENLVTNCPSMVSSDGGMNWQPGTFPPGHPRSPEGVADLAFELTTDEVSTNDPGGPIVITNIAVNPALGRYTLESVGTYGAGQHSLQCCTNLLVSNDWRTVETRASVFPPPLVNTWFRTPAHSNEFYRIHEQ
jgi:hypothetical protein